jgi:hypothetical protein
MSIIPLLVGMIGVPYIMVFWIANYFYPIQGDPRYQHFFLLGISLWLITIGPHRSLVDSFLGLFKKTKVKTS